MNNSNKNNLVRALLVLILVIAASIGVGSSFGCFNYATLAKKAGEPDNIFWLIGVLNLASWGFAIYLGAKAIKNSNGHEKE